MYLLYNSQIREEAFNDFDLLEKVAAFKQKFYRSNRAKYDEANKEGLKLLPPQECMDDLLQDYASMQSMIFGTTIPFEEILKGLEQMLDEIRAL